MSHGGGGAGGSKKCKKVSRIIWMAPYAVILFLSSDKCIIVSFLLIQDNLIFLLNVGDSYIVKRERLIDWLIDRLLIPLFIYVTGEQVKPLA